MKKFLFSICFVLFCNTVQAQCINGSCGNVYPSNGACVNGSCNVQYSQSMNYVIRGVTEQERFYVNVKSWNRNYTIPVINGILPEMTLNGSYNNVILDYSSGIEYTREKYGNMKVINYLSNENLKVSNTNGKPSAPKGPGILKAKSNTNVPKKPSDEEIDNIFGTKALKVNEINFQKPSSVKNIQADSDEFIDNLFSK